MAGVNLGSLAELKVARPRLGGLCFRFSGGGIGGAGGGGVGGVVMGGWRPSRVRGGALLGGIAGARPLDILREE